MKYPLTLLTRAERIPEPKSKMMIVLFRPSLSEIMPHVRRPRELHMDMTRTPMVAVSPRPLATAMGFAKPIIMSPPMQASIRERVMI